MQKYRYCKLYDEQRMILWLLVKECKPMTYKEIADALNLNVTQTVKLINNSQLNPLVREFFNKDLNSSSVELIDNTFLFCNKISLIKKEKNILHFYFLNGIMIDYDFITKKIINVDENTIFIISKRLMYSFDGDDHMLNDIFDVIITNPNYSIPEWIFSYPDLLQKSYEDNPGLFNFLLPKYPKTIKKGYIQYCRKNKCPIGYLSYRKFLIKSIFGNNKELLSFFTKIEEYIPLDIDFSSIESSMLRQVISTLFKFYRYSVKHNEIFIPSQLSFMFIDILKQPEILTLLDTNRGVKTNLQLMQNYLDKKNSEKLAEQLQKLNFINDMIIEDYIIKVPQSLEDLIDEGKQQHNCVGSFYNDSIRAGKNLIYFIRKKGSSEKSYVTCRYSIEDKETVEHRFVNNERETFELLSVRRKIDNIIKDNLKM